MTLFIRFITALCLFSFLGKANIWLNSLSNIILAVGYRLFLVLSPFFDRVFGKYAVTAALFCAAIGAFFLCFSQPILLFFGALIAAIGFSVSGYVVKAIAAETPKGAGYNRMVLNAGTLLAGIILLVHFELRVFFFGSATLLLFLLTLISFFTSRKTVKPIVLPTPKKFCKKTWLAWLLVGVAVGTNLFAVFAVLPQYLIKTIGSLPSWYGSMIFLNGVAVIICQLPIIHALERMKANDNAFKIVLCMMLIGMVILGFPQLFYVRSFWGATIWIFLLSVAECAASYLDVLGSRSGYLFIKEVSIGLGAGLTVWLNRELPSPWSSLSIATAGALAIIIASALLYKQFTKSPTP